MSKFKKMIFVIVAIIAIILTITMTVLEAVDTTGNLTMILNIGDNFVVLPEDVINENSFYCVAEDQELYGDPTEYIALGMVAIDGNDAYFYEQVQNQNEADVTNKNANGKTSYYKLHKVTNSINNVLAAILTTNEDIQDINYMTLLNGLVNDQFTEEEIEELGGISLCLHLLWNDWVTATGAHDYGFRSSNWSDNSLTRPVVDKWKSQVEKLTPYYNFKAKIVFGVCSGYQNLIYVEVDPPTPRNVTVIKVWDDDNNRDGKRPSSIKITLMANGSKVTVDANGNSIQNPVTLTSSNADSENPNTWKYTFNNLPQALNGKEIEYTVEEENVEGYYLVE